MNFKEGIAAVGLLHMKRFVLFLMISIVVIFCEKQLRENGLEVERIKDRL
jgi:hypothetical protein